MSTAKDKLFNFEATPPSGIWDRLSEELTEGKVVQINSRKKTRKIAIMTAAAAAIIIFLISTVFNRQSDNAPVLYQLASADIAIDSLKKDNQLLEEIINAPIDKKLSTSREIASESPRKYFTIEGSEGELVKISPKVATLILSANKGFPPKPVWDKKISEWQNIMLTKSLSASPSDLIEIIQETANNIN